MPKKIKPVTQFTQRNVGDILEECRVALGPIAEKYGLTLDRKGRTYQQDSLPVMFQLMIKQVSEDGTVLTAAGQDFIKYAPMYGLEAEDLGKTFTNQGDTYEITGFKPKSRKYPVLGKKVGTSKTYKFMVETVKAGIKRAA